MWNPDKNIRVSMKEVTDCSASKTPVPSVCSLSPHTLANQQPSELLPSFPCSAHYSKLSHSNSSCTLLP